MKLEIVSPEALGAPSGYSHGVVVPAEARLLLVAGQIGVESGAAAPGGLAAQFAAALDRVLAVVRAAGGEPSSIARLTVFVTDLAAYRAERKALGEAWRTRFGHHYPAMALIEVRGLVEPKALVEIEATAALPRAR
jgi:enamine deaminase RidA (YjgF/YER057c/UK114 family)